MGFLTILFAAAEYKHEHDYSLPWGHIKYNLKHFWLIVNNYNKWGYNNQSYFKVLQNKSKSSQFELQ